MQELQIESAIIYSEWGKTIYEKKKAIYGLTINSGINRLGLPDNAHPSYYNYLF